MGQRKLTDGLLRAAAAPARGRLELSDAQCPGLAFRVTRAGARSWSFRFRDPESGKLTRTTLGQYPAVGLKAARRAADRARGQVANGSNPNEAKRAAMVEAPRRAFRVLAARYISEHAKRHKRSWAADERNLKKHVLPKWKDRDYLKIRRADAVEIVEGLISAGKPTLANRVGVLLSGVFNFAIDAGLRDDNPAARLSRRGQEQVGRRVLRDSEVRLLWPATAGRPPITRRVGLALRLCLLTACRPGEAAGASRDEFRNLADPLAATWIIPANRTKNGRANALPLSAMARAVVAEAAELIGDRSEYLFPARLSMTRPVAAKVLATAMHRLAGMIEGEGAATWQDEPPTPHDLRRTARTRLSELGTPRDVCDAILNHTPPDVGRRVYDLYEKLPEKRAALDKLADMIEAILAPSVVVSFPRAAG